MKDAYSCDRDDGRPRRELPGPVRRLRADFERLGLDDDRGRQRRRDHGRHRRPRVHGPQPSRRGHPRPVRRSAATRRTADRRDRASPIPPPRTPLPIEEVATPGHDDDRDARRVPRHPRDPDGQGRLLHDRRRPPRHGDRPRRLRGQRDEARRTRSRRSAASGPRRSRRSRPPGMEPGYGSPIGAHDTVVVVDELVARSPNLVAGANRVGFHSGTSTSGRDFTPDVVADITNAREGDPCPTCGSAGDPPQRDRGRQHLQARDEVHRRRRRRPTSARTASEHPIVMGSYGIGVGRNVACIVEAPPRREGDRLAGGGRAVRRPPRRDRREQGPAGRRDRRAPPRRRRGRRLLARTSSTTTATSRRA